MEVSTVGRRSISVVLVVSWCLLVGGGVAQLVRYEWSAGDSGAAVGQWPEGSTLSAPTERPALWLFAHAACPCTRATLTELGILARDIGHLVDIGIVFSHQPDTPDVVAADLLTRARALPGVLLVMDPDNREHRRFGVLTSGHALLFDKDGRRVFDGGLTRSRGHVGAGPGAMTIRTWLAEGGDEHGHASVFGCAFQAESSDS